MKSSNIASYLSMMADSLPDNDAIIIAGGNGQYNRVSFHELEEASNHLGKGFLNHGISSGTKVVVMVKPGREFFCIIFALFKIGAVVVAIDPGMGIKNLGACLKEAEPEVFIGVPAAHLARSIFRWASNTLKTHIIVNSKFISGKITLQAVQKSGIQSSMSLDHHTAEEDIAAILFTSGSTGVPKGVVYNHGNFLAQVHRLKDTYEIKPGELDLATFPLFALFAPALGMTSIIPYMDFTRPGHVEPNNIIEPINKFKATTMFASPALLNRVGRYGKKHHIKLESLNRVLSAGAPVANQILRNFSLLLRDGVNIYTPYGATEALPVSSIGSNEVFEETGALSEKGFGTCVGKAVEDLTLKIITISDDEIPEWDEGLVLEKNVIGEIAVKGPQVTASYFNRSHSTRLAKIHCNDGSFYHRMGDLGYLDEQNRLWFCGRKSERVQIKEQVLYTTQCEGIFNQHQDIKQTALVGIGADEYKCPVLCVEAEKDVDKDQLVRELATMAKASQQTQSIKHFICHPGFPVDIRHNAKINRQSLTKWAEKKLG